MEGKYKIEVIDKSGKGLGRFADFGCFENVNINEGVVYLAVKSYLANQRQGTHKSKERSEIAGSTKKIGRQKGGGGARRGDMNSPLLRGGGRVFGPKPNDYENKINKKEKALAFSSAFKSILENSAVSVVDDLNFSEIKTKNFTKLMDGLKMDEKKNLILIKEKNDNLFLSTRNLKNVDVRIIDKINVYDVLNTNKVFLTEECVEELCKRIKN